MGFFRKLREGWRLMSTEEKVNLVVDILCGVGSASIGFTAGKKLSEGKGVVETICIQTTAMDLSYAAGDLAAKELKTNVSPAVGGLIDKIKELRNTKSDDAEVEE